jgi:hypothetical protein
MEVVLAGAEFFNQTQRDALAIEAVKTIAALNTLLLALVGLVVTLVFIKANALRKGQQITHELLEHPKPRGRARAEDSKPVVSREMRELRAPPVVRPDSETGDFQERRRDTSQPVVPPGRGEIAGDGDQSEPMREVF